MYEHRDRTRHFLPTLNIHSSVLEPVLTWCHRHQFDEEILEAAYALNMPYDFDKQTMLSPWDVTFKANHQDNITQLATAAQYLDIPSLKILCSVK